MNVRRLWVILINALLFLLADLLPAQTIHVSLQDRTVEGKPLFWNDQVVALVERDGNLVTFQPFEAESFRKVSSTFRSYTQGSLRGVLLKEFGASFDVSGTGQYLVVHPKGQRDLWADRFEQLYRSMLQYLGARRLLVRRPEFPLVAVVFHSRGEYLANSRDRGDTVSPNSLGYYDPVTNRIYMYDAAPGSTAGSDWHINAETIIHEAAHQTAFNVGIHDRLGRDPRWVVEGLGTLFEARGVWDSRHYPNLSDRINRVQLESIRHLFAETDSAELLQRQIAYDQLFARASATAYAHAWALTFYLTEREPGRYADYLRRLGQRAPFQSYAEEERLRDFTAVFGHDLKMLDARLKGFINAL